MRERVYMLIDAIEGKAGQVAQMLRGQLAENGGPAGGSIRPNCDALST